MNRPQAIALALAFANLLLALAFPPHDYVSLQRGNVPTFDGFYFLFGNQPNRVINRDLLTLEILVLLINLGIAWLLLRERPIGRDPAGGNRFQRAVLWLVGANLVLALLFPPFQNYAAITRAVLPSFEGFYFLFGDNSQRQLVAPILYIEVCLILVNGAILWLLFKRDGGKALAPDEVRALATALRDGRQG